MMTKYGNVVVSAAGMSFGSKLEAAVYQILYFRLLAGEIKEIQQQDHLLLCGPPGHECDHKSRIQYIADFKCTRPAGTVFWVEAKGFKTEGWEIKKRLYRHYGPGALEIWGGDWKRPKLTEMIIP